MIAVPNNGDPSVGIAGDEKSHWTGRSRVCTHEQVQAILLIFFLHNSSSSLNYLSSSFENKQVRCSWLNYSRPPPLIYVYSVLVHSSWNTTAPSSTMEPIPWQALRKLASAEMGTILLP